MEIVRRDTPYATLAALPEALLRIAFRRRPTQGRAASLHSLDDRTLKDIGFDRGEAAAAALGFQSGRFRHNPAEA